MTYYVNGYNLRGYMPDPDNLHVFATLEAAREDHADTLRRWADECYYVCTPHEDEREDLEAISAELAGDAETVHEWITEQGGATGTRGPDGNEYTFWTAPRTREELAVDGWTAEDLEHLDD